MLLVGPRGGRSDRAVSPEFLRGRKSEPPGRCATVAYGRRTPRRGAGKQAIRLQGRVTAMTGAALGIGRATAFLFAAEDATAAIGDVEVDTAAMVVKEFGRLDVMFATAGIAYSALLLEHPQRGIGYCASSRPGCFCAARGRSSPKRERRLSGRAEQSPEREADTLAGYVGLTRHAVDVVPLTRSAHHEQAPVVQLDRAGRPEPRAPWLQDESPRRAERECGDDRVEAELGLIVRVETDTVGAVAVAVEQNVIEGDAGALAHAGNDGRYRRCGRARFKCLSRVPIARGSRPGDQSGLKDAPAEKHDLPVLPGELAPHRGQEPIGLRRLHPTRHVLHPGTCGKVEAGVHSDIIALGKKL